MARGAIGHGAGACCVDDRVLAALQPGRDTNRFSGAGGERVTHRRGEPSSCLMFGLACTGANGDSFLCRTCHCC